MAMKHKWIKKELTDLDKKYNLEIDICKTCGCERMKSYTGYFYSRSGMPFQYRPDCIDEEVEALKTID